MPARYKCIALPCMLPALALGAGCADLRVRPPRPSASDYLRGAGSAVAAQGAALRLSPGGAGQGMFLLLRYGAACKGTFPPGGASGGADLYAARSLFQPGAELLGGQAMRGRALVATFDAAGQAVAAVPGPGALPAWSAGTVPVPVQRGEDPACALTLEQVAGYDEDTAAYRYYVGQSGALALRTGGVATMGDPARFTEHDASGAVIDARKTSLAANGFIRESSFDNASGLYTVSLYYADTRDLVSSDAITSVDATRRVQFGGPYAMQGFDYAGTIEGDGPVAAPSYLPVGGPSTFVFNATSGGVDVVAGVAFRPADPITDGYAPIIAQDVYINTGDRVPLLRDGAGRPSISSPSSGIETRTYDDLQAHVARLAQAGAGVDLAGTPIVDLRRTHDLSAALKAKLRSYDGLSEPSRCGAFQIIWVATDDLSGRSAYQGTTGLIPAADGTPCP